MVIVIDKSEYHNIVEALEELMYWPDETELETKAKQMLKLFREEQKGFPTWQVDAAIIYLLADITTGGGKQTKNGRQKVWNMLGEIFAENIKLRDVK